MFLDTLSIAVLRLCDSHQWSYEAAAEQCELSVSCIRDILRKKTAPTIRTLEKLCTGFGLLPNDLLIPSAWDRELRYRLPMRITRCWGYYDLHGFTTFPLCPRCAKCIEREYQAFCDRCGQKLNWRGFYNAELIVSESKK